MIEFDHIAIGTSNLNDGVKWAEGKLHSKIPYGGKHDQMGTHNHVLSSGNKTYLEILSKDLSAPPNKRNTWFHAGQRLPTRWCPRLILVQ